MNSDQPSKIKLHRQSQTLELVFGEQSFTLSAEFLRVHSPSAEVKGHGPGQEVLQLIKESVEIIDLVAQGRYAIKLVFSDGHDSGLFTWAYLKELGQNQASLWQSYCEKRKAPMERSRSLRCVWLDPFNGTHACTFLMRLALFAV